MSAEKVGLSIYLLKDAAVAEFRRDLFDSNNSVIPLSDRLDGAFLPLPAPQKEPNWAIALRELLGTVTGPVVRSQSAGGLLAITRNAKTYAICFGHAWLRLRLGWVVHDFGRRVVLNAVPKDQLLEINAEQVFAKWHLSRERAPRATAFNNFDIESERDLVSVIEGVPKDKDLGSVIRGGTSLRLTVPLAQLAPILDKLDRLYRSKSHEKLWPEFYNLVPIKDPDAINDLDAELDTALGSGDAAKRVVLFAPSFRREDYPPANSYVFGRLLKSGATAPYLMYGSWEGALKKMGKVPSVASAKDTPVHFLDEAHEEIVTAHVYECLGFETTLRGRQHVLTSGIWYVAGHEFIDAINKRIASLRTPAVTLPSWDTVSSEGEYNLLCASKIKQLLHLDAKNIHFGGGQSKFEFCDLMHIKERTLYFAKIPSRSSDMSHLSEQVRRTVELFFSPDGKFRTAVKAALRKQYAGLDTTWLDARPKPGEFTLCLISLGRDKTKLPFFAKCGLARLIKELEERGHQIAFQAV